MKKYDFPVKNKFHARAVIELDYEIDPISSDALYVDLDEVRGREYLDRMRFNLNIDNDRLEELSDFYTKIIFSGHKGTGKSLELKKFHHYLNNPQRYFSIFIELEKELEIATFQPEDIFVLLIVKVIEAANEKEVDLNLEYLDDLVKDWLANTEIKEELKDSYKLDIGSEAEIGASVFFVKLKSRLKAVYSSESKTSREIRQKIKRNPLDLINRFNNTLSDLRDMINKQNKGKDILFILDGTERMPYDKYLDLFIKDANLIKAINSNMIFSVPINSYYNIESNPAVEFFQTFILPMVVINAQSIPKLSEIISRRIDTDSFIDADALQYCVKKSGGCIRQLLRIVHRALNITFGKKISPQAAEKSAKELGKEMITLLDSEHIVILEEEEYKHADQKVLELLFSLVVLKYNGDRQINPLVKDLL